MIYYVTGDLFESPAQTLVNTVNTVGVMGKGIALTFKKIYPEMFAEYQTLCDAQKLQVGSLFLWRTPNKQILNFPTKKHWKHPSRPEWIEVGLERFVMMYQQAGITSVAFPPLGCGNGELDFTTDVQPLMEQYLGPLPIPVFIYAPRKTAHPPEHRAVDEIRAWLRAEPQSLPFSEVWADLQELYRQPRTVMTFSGSSAFEVEFVSEADTLRTRAAGKVTSFGREELCEIWDELRYHLVLTKAAFAHRQRVFSYLLPVLAELPYVEVFQLGEQLTDLDYSPSWAIHLVPAPRSQANQREMLLTG